MTITRDLAALTLPSPEPDCDHGQCSDSGASQCLYAEAGNLIGTEIWPVRATPKGGKHPPLPDPAPLAAWVRRFVEEADVYAYESLAWDLAGRWGWDPATAIAGEIGNISEGWGSKDTDARRLSVLLGWQQSVLFSAWFSYLPNYRLARELGWRPADAGEIEEDAAAAWLRRLLAEAPVAQSRVEAESQIEGIRPHALFCGAQQLGVIASTDDGEHWRIHPGVSHENCYLSATGQRARWTWRLPEPGAGTEP